MVELAGKTIGILGFGNIGKRVAEIANAFKLNVLVYTAHPEKYEGTEEAKFVQFVSQDELFSRSDIVSLHCPMTKETEQIICTENIAKMKDGVVIINVSRGGLVNEAELAEALKSGKVRMAAVDVVTKEPMEASNPLLTAPNMIITPHLAWASVEARKRLVEVIAGNFESYLKGEKKNVVS